jgi:hypothetical protein
MNKNNPRPPNDRGQGRKPLSSAEKTVSMTIRVTPSQRVKVEALGVEVYSKEQQGAQWLRDRIDEAPEPGEKPKRRRKS